MRIRTLAEANKSLSFATRDRGRLLCCLQEIAELHKIPMHKQTELLLMHLWPDVRGDDRYLRWKTLLEVRIQEITTYIESVDTFIRNWKPRSCMPKKKQREQGLLPPV
jgi:hypothetical protein